MAKEFTKCVEPEDFTDLSFQSWVGYVFVGQGVAVLVALIVLAVIAALTPMTAKPAILAAMLLVADIIIYLSWWLNGRLICLNEADRNCAIIGRVVRHGLSDDFKGGDDDYTMNLLLAPGQEHLLAVNPRITGIGRGYDDRESYRAHLHCEFEGDGIYLIREFMYAILAMLTLALIAPWPADLIICIFVLLMALFVGLVDFRAPNQAMNPGNPLDVNVNLGTLTPGDLVVVKGEWIYDSLHKGWHEIHPVRHCEIIQEAERLLEEGKTLETLEWSDYGVIDPATGLPVDFEDPASAESYRQFWCGSLHRAEEAEEHGSRADPKNDWTIHPLVDGCSNLIIT
jgi:hypothetical protein